MLIVECNTMWCCLLSGFPLINTSGSHQMLLSPRQYSVNAPSFSMQLHTVGINTLLQSSRSMPCCQKFRWNKDSVSLMHFSLVLTGGLLYCIQKQGQCIICTENEIFIVEACILLFTTVSVCCVIGPRQWKHFCPPCIGYSIEPCTKASSSQDELIDYSPMCQVLRYICKLKAMSLECFDLWAFYYLFSSFSRCMNFLCPLQWVPTSNTWPTRSTWSGLRKHLCSCLHNDSRGLKPSGLRQSCICFHSVMDNGIECL